MSTNVGVDSSIDKLMKAMGSKKGFDPIPPDQYLFHLESEDPEIKAQAYILSCTIRQGRRAPYCVDEHGNPITRRRMAADCGWTETMTGAYLERLEAKGLIKIERGKEPGAHRELRIYLCGEVTPMSRRKEEDDGAKKRRKSESHTQLLPDYQLKVFNELASVTQKEILKELEAIADAHQKLAAEMAAARRKVTEAALDQVYNKYGLPKRKMDKPDKADEAKPQRFAIQISLFDAQTKNGVHDFEESVRSFKTAAYVVSNGTVHSFSGGPSINTETETEKTSSVPSDVHQKSSAAAASSVRAAAAARPESAQGGTATARAREPESVAPILEAFEPAGGITDTNARQVLNECRQGIPDATIDEVRAKGAELLANILRNPKASNPYGVLVKALPKFFQPGEALTRWRKNRDRAAPREVYTGMLINGRIPQSTWDEMSHAERDQWKELGP